MGSMPSPVISAPTKSPSPPSPMLELVQAIGANAILLDGYLTAHGLPQPSFEADAPTTVLPPTAPKPAQHACLALADAAFKLFNLMTGPSGLLLNITANFQTAHALEWLIHFDVLSHVPLAGSVPYGNLAAATGVPESQLKSVARMAMTSAILAEPEPGRVAHSAASAMFVKKPLMADWARFMFATPAPTAAAMVRQTERWPGSVKNNETAYNVALNHDLPFFDHLSRDPVLTKQFAGYMKSVTDGQGVGLAHVVEGFDWGSLPQGALVVDVGGSTGHASYAVAAAYSHLRFEVQDLSAVLADTSSNSNGSSAKGVKSRVSFKAHDFFQPQPTHGAAVYFLRMIIHDWPDVEAETILGQLVPALVPGVSTLLIMDTVLPAPGQLPSVRERVIRSRDMTMRQVFNSHERGIEDWERLLKKTDPRLRLRSVRQPEGSNMSLLAISLEERTNGFGATNGNGVH